MNRKDNFVTCETQPKANVTEINDPQPIWISWMDLDVPAQNTGFSFAYKPNPVINDIMPNITILRYLSDGTHLIIQ